MPDAHTETPGLIERLTDDAVSPAEMIGYLASYMLQLAPAAGLYVGIKIEPAALRARQTKED